MSRIFEGVNKARSSNPLAFAGLDKLDLEEVAAGAGSTEIPLSRFLYPQIPPVTRTVRLVPSSAAPIPFLQANNATAIDEYRSIRTSLLHHPRKPQVIAVFSPSAGDGKTSTAINVASSVALTEGHRVLLIDGNLRRPSVAACLGLSSFPGLTELISGNAALDSTLLCAEQLPHLCLLTAGKMQKRSSELLESTRWHTLMQQLRSRFTFIVIDSPPLREGADSQLIQIMSDGIVLVMRPHSSDRESCIAALRTIPKAKLLGAVLNAVPNGRTPSKSTG